MSPGARIAPPVYRRGTLEAAAQRQPGGCQHEHQDRCPAERSVPDRGRLRSLRRGRQQDRHDGSTENRALSLRTVGVQALLRRHAQQGELPGLLSRHSSRRLLALVCMTMGANTFSVGAFPTILPELGGAARLADWQLGMVASAFGFARMVTDVPAGLFITHHLRRALVLAPLFLTAGVVCLGAGGPLWLLLLGRALMGAGHTLSMVAGLTAVLRHREASRLASSLSAIELTAMLGMLGGVTLIGL